MHPKRRWALNLKPTSIRIVIALDEMHSRAVLSLLVFFCEVAVGVRASVERDQLAPVQTAPQLSDRTPIFLPRSKGSRFALARLIVKYGYCIAGQSGMPYASTYSRTIARREQDAPTPQQSSIGCGLPGPYGGDVYWKARLPISVYRRISPLASEKSPHGSTVNVTSTRRY